MGRVSEARKVYNDLIRDGATHPDPGLEKAWQALVTAVTAVECVFCYQPIVFRHDDPVIHVGCSMAQDAEWAP